MSPEKVAVLLVTALITALLATALLNAEKAEASPRTEAAKAAASAPPPRREDPLEDLTYDELRSGRFRPAPVLRQESGQEGPVAPPATYDYTIRRGDTARVIARRELGGERFVASIARLNPDVDIAKLKTGNKLKLPVPKSKPALKTTGKSGQPTVAPKSTSGSALKAPSGTSKASAPKTAVKKSPASAPKKAVPTPAPDPKKTKSASNSGTAIRPRTV